MQAAGDVDAISEVVKQIRAVSAEPIKCVLLGVRWVVVRFDESEAHVDHRCLGECFFHASVELQLKPPFKERIRESWIEVPPFGNTDAIWFGSEAAMRVLDLLRDANLDDRELFDPLAQREHLFRKTKYSRVKLEAFKASGRSRRKIQAHDAETLVPDAEIEAPDAKTEVTYAKTDVSYRLVRFNHHVDLYGSYYSDTTKKLPIFEAAPKFGSEPMSWIFEVVFSDFAYAAVEAITRLAPESPTEQTAGGTSPASPEQNSDPPHLENDQLKHKQEQGGKKPYPDPKKLPQDKWIFENIIRLSFKEMNAQYAAIRGQNGWTKITSKNGFKKRADVYADYHDKPRRRFSDRIRRATG